MIRRLIPSAFALVCTFALCPRTAAAQEADEALLGELRALVKKSEEPGAPGGILGLLRRGEPFFVQLFGLA